MVYIARRVSGSSVDGFTATRVPFADANGFLTDNAGLTFASATHLLTVGDGTVATPDLRINGSSSGRVTTVGNVSLILGTNLTARVTIGSAAATISDAYNLISGTATGTKIGTATTQKWGFWNATPVIQPTRVGPIVDNSGGTSTSPTIPAVVAAPVDTGAASLVSTQNAVASLAAAITSIETRLSAAVAGGLGLTA
jgi:hypothetical protein